MLIMSIRKIFSVYFSMRHCSCISIFIFYHTMKKDVKAVKVFHGVYDAMWVFLSFSIELHEIALISKQSYVFHVTLDTDIVNHSG